MYEIGNQSLFFLTVVMGFIGMILVYQAGLQTKRVVPDLSHARRDYLELLVRDLAASIGALMLATRVGAGIAAEIGSMVVTEQVDALRMCAADPIDYLIKPRFLASIVMTTVLGRLGGGRRLRDRACSPRTSCSTCRPRTFCNLQPRRRGRPHARPHQVRRLRRGDPDRQRALRASRPSAARRASGWATTRAVVNSSLAVIVLDMLISGAGFFIFPKG